MSERPPSLSPRAKRALAQYAQAHRMPPDVRARISDALDEPPAPAERPRNFVWAAIGGLAAALLLWGIVSFQDSSFGARYEPHVPQEAPMQASGGQADTQVEPHQARARRAVPGPVPVPDSVDPEPAPSVVTPSPPTKRRLPRRNPTPKTAQPQPTPAAVLSDPATLAIENRLITKTWSHVTAKRYADARSTLDEHARRFPDGVLAPERAALEVIVHCLEGHDDAATRASKYLRGHANSVLTHKVRNACEKKNAPQ